MQIKQVNGKGLFYKKKYVSQPVTALIAPYNENIIEHATHVYPVSCN